MQEKKNTPTPVESLVRVESVTLYKGISENKVNCCKERVENDEPLSSWCGSSART